MGSTEANIVVSKIRGFIQAVLTTPSGPGVLGEERLRAIYQNAIGIYEKALAIDREVLGEKHPSTAIDYDNLGGAWNKLGQYQKAIGYYEKALAIDREVLGKKHPSIARDYNNLGEAWDSLGEYRKAIGYYEKALDLYSGVLPKGHPHIRNVEANLAEAKKQQTR